ncbi:uncharacterized protein FTJAE_12743 [Fusarium tjaetaba]|uniref:Uncharacterized protein n=1 Tax=Fusarium tjaetaba TaxID=1567544 RepID=A0A8H5VBA2_9HYPO|nr:uncharacterized protein FTJAE_12743 [Fusarium tjaetaba]KAF5617221.1 hypothetical protein FTJAE_12743 [Fusarium tjaetaba]
MEDSTRIAQRHAAALKLLEDLTSSLNDVEPLGDISRAQADYDAAEERHSREQNPEKKRALCRELVRYGDRLEEIQKQHKEADAKRKEQLDLFNSRLSKEGYLKLATRVSSNTGTGTNRDHDGDQTTHRTSTSGTPENPVANPDLDSSQLSGPSNDRSTHETTRSPGSLTQTPTIWNTIEARSTPSRIHSATPSRWLYTDLGQQGVTEPAGQTARPNKRSDNAVSRPTKRQRQSASSDTVTERTITFEEVYQGGKARWKYRIVKIHELYYIFGCKRHDKHFCKENPLQAAMSHLKGKGHSSKKSNATQALKSLGIQVLGCTDPDLELNNKAVDCYLAEQERKKERRDASTNDLLQPPQAGRIYMAWWCDDDKDYCLHAFLVIPFFPQIGDGMDIQSVLHSDLEVDVPACYKLNETTHWYEWAEGYNKHEKHVNNREYPIMCLSGEIPHKVDWLPVCHFRKLNLEDEDLEDKDVIKAFIRSKGIGKFFSMTLFCFSSLLTKPNTGQGNEVESDQIKSLYGDRDVLFPRPARKSCGAPYETFKRNQRYVTAKKRGRRRIGPNLPTREVKPEPAPMGGGDEATRQERQPSVRQRWPLARKNAPYMETLEDSDSE